MNKNKEYVISDDTSMVKGIIERGKIINELKENNNYDQKIVDFYHDGFFEIKGEKIRVDSVSLNVVKTENEEKNIIRFGNICGALSNDLEIIHFRKLRDTSIFEKLVNKYKDMIKDNTLEINDEVLNYLNSLKWDGKYHELVPETHYISLYLADK